MSQLSPSRPNQPSSSSPRTEDFTANRTLYQPQTYSRPSGGLYCILYPEGRLVANREGKACCFESRNAALDFIKGRPELGEAFQVQEVFLTGQIHGWEKVPAEAVEEKTIKELEYGGV